MQGVGAHKTHAEVFRSNFFTRGVFDCLPLSSSWTYVQLCRATNDMSGRLPQWVTVLRFPLWVKSGHVHCTRRCLLCAKSGHPRFRSHQKKNPGTIFRGFTLAIHGLLRCIRTHEFTAAWASAADLDQRRLPYFYIVSDVRRLGIEASRG